jgi:hypothetical protein
MGTWESDKRHLNILHAASKHFHTTLLSPAEQTEILSDYQPRIKLSQPK